MGIRQLNLCERTRLRVIWECQSEVITQWGVIFASVGSGKLEEKIWCEDTAAV
jgi:hypothetical protein